ncbi:MAG: asparagine synthase (glutamine-hydrolyzing) [Cyclobacteriaceae bacterium]
MCGISISISRHNDPIRNGFIRSFNDKVAHRGPDDEGFYFGNNFAFGHRRLSILDLSKAGHQPMQRNHLIITYNGEIYNYIELRDELALLGHTFKSATDTEVILAAYEQWGIDSFAKLNGMWAFAIYDSSKDEIIFSRDHFGIKPLYFAKTKSFFMAGSEIKQFTTIEEFKPILNKEVAINFLIQGLQNYSDDTFFEGVKELLGGHYMVYSLSTHNFAIKKWYDLSKSAKKIYDKYENVVAEVRRLFENSVRIRMRSDVTVGSCLSGGIDSSSIVTIIHSQKMANRDFVTVTSCYDDKKYDEQEYSDIVTSKTGFKNSKTYPQLNHLWDEKHLDKMIYHQDQPFSGASCYSEFKVFENARNNNVIVMQDGQGADEYLCGYDEFFMIRVNEMFDSFHWFGAYRLLKLRSTFKDTSFIHEFQSFLNLKYIYKLKRIVKKIIGINGYTWLQHDWSKEVSSKLVNLDENRVRELSITELLRSSIPFQLHSEDRNSMMFSVESRLPFLDPRLVEYCVGLPSSYKIKNGYSKAVLRDAVTELPDEIRQRKKKMGFVAPDSQWILDNKDRVREDLKEAIGSTGIFSNELLERFDRFVSGELKYENIYFRAMTLKRFLDIFKVRIS